MKKCFLISAACCLLQFVNFLNLNPALFAQKSSGFQESDSGFVRFEIHFVTDPRVPLQRETEFPGMTLSGYNQGAAYKLPGNVQHKAQLDSSGQFITISQTIKNVPVRLPRIMAIEDYNRLESRRRIAENWRTAAVRNIIEGPTGGRRGPGGLNISIPVPIKSKTFQKIFGGDQVGLNVQGDISIKGGFRNEDRSEAKTSLAQGSNSTFKMDQTQRFTVTGKIGEKVTVNVDQDSERSFDFDNNLKLNYKGFDDEIIESIEAGNISLA